MTTVTNPYLGMECLDILMDRNIPLSPLSLNMRRFHLSTSKMLLLKENYASGTILSCFWSYDIERHDTD